MPSAPHTSERWIFPSSMGMWFLATCTLFLQRPEGAKAAVPTQKVGNTIAQIPVTIKMLPPGVNKSPSGSPVANPGKNALSKSISPGRAPLPTAATERSAHSSAMEKLTTRIGGTDLLTVPRASAFGFLPAKAAKTSMSPVIAPTNAAPAQKPNVSPCHWNGVGRTDGHHHPSGRLKFGRGFSFEIGGADAGGSLKIPANSSNLTPPPLKTFTQPTPVAVSVPGTNLATAISITNTPATAKTTTGQTSLPAPSALPLTTTAFASTTTPTAATPTNPPTTFAAIAYAVPLVASPAIVRTKVDPPANVVMDTSLGQSGPILITTNGNGVNDYAMDETAGKVVGINLFYSFLSSSSPLGNRPHSMSRIISKTSWRESPAVVHRPSMGLLSSTARLRPTSSS